MPRSRKVFWQRIRHRALDPVSQLRFSLVLLLLIVALGTLGYMLLEGWSWDEALYMTVITVTTVGYAEVQPLDASGRYYTILLIILGVGAVAWAVTRAFDVTLGEAFWSSVRKRRMNERVARLRDHYIVCGYGRLGRRIVQDLRSRGEPFLVLDWDEEVETELLRQEIPHIRDDATRDETLRAANVQEARGLVSALDSDAANVLTVLSAREINPGLLIVARANAETSERKLVRAGADRVVTPESIGGHRLALALLRPSVHDFLNRIFSFHPEMEVDVGQVQISSSSPLAGQRVSDCDLRQVRNVSILGVQRPGGELILNPSPEKVLEARETLILIGPAEAIYDLEAMYHAPKE